MMIGAFEKRTKRKVQWQTKGRKQKKGSAGIKRGAQTPDARLAFSFHGTGVCVIGNRDRIGGLADVSVDGRPAQTADTYAETEDDRKTKLSVPKTRNAIAAVYGLAPGRHSLELRPGGAHNALSQGCQISVEAVEITGGEGLLESYEA